MEYIKAFKHQASRDLSSLWAIEHGRTFTTQLLRCRDGLRPSQSSHQLPENHSKIHSLLNSHRQKPLPSSSTPLSKTASPYIPPHMRRTLNTPTSSSNPHDQTSERDPATGYTSDEIATQFSCTTALSTLNSTDHDNNSLSFILVFAHQHPEWPPKIFCKSNLHLLPSPPKHPDIDAKNAQPSASQETDTAPGSPIHNQGLSIPIFTQTQTQPPRFLYAGARALKSVTYVQPGSAELIRMLDMKFSPLGKARTPEKWQASLSVQWAVLEMGEVEGGKNPMVPLREGQGVVEMLRELRGPM